MIWLLVFYCAFAFLFMCGVVYDCYSDACIDGILSAILSIIVILLAPIIFPICLGVKVRGINL